MSALADLLDQLETALQAGAQEQAKALIRAFREALAKAQQEPRDLEARFLKLVEAFESTPPVSRASKMDVPERNGMHKRAMPPQESLVDQDLCGLGGAPVYTSASLSPEPAPCAPLPSPIVFKEAAPESTEDATVPEVEDGACVCPLWFGTNRKPADPSDLSKGFTGERSPTTTLGRAEVRIPKAHRFGETGTSLWKRLLRFDLRDDHLRLQRIQRRDASTLWAELQAEMQEARDAGEEPHALFFLHGYNNDFEQAAIRAAQLHVDLKVPGATGFFSWPSRGNPAAYPADEASIEASESAITEFLVAFAQNCGASKVHVIAHSMGNRGFLRALQRIASHAELQSSIRFGQIFLAAPDLDRDLFLDLAHLYAACSERTTLYASNGDLPVNLSARLHDAPRAGYFLPYTVAPKIDTVSVPDFDLDLLGHSYFAQAEALLGDMYHLMRHNTPPEGRQRLRALTRDQMKLWEISR